MTSSFSKSKYIVLDHIWIVMVIHLLCIHNGFFIKHINALNQTNAYLHHQCINSQGKYKSGSVYEETLNKNVKLMSEHMLDGYGSGSGGDEQNTVYSKIQCRGDLDLSQCRSCLATAFSEISKRCPQNKGRIIWYDHCVFELSSIYRVGQIDYQSNFYINNKNDMSDNKESFNKKTKALLYKLKENASKEKDTSKKNYLYATGEESLGTKKLYAMVQCSKDLTIKNCSVCLKWIIEKLPKCCNGKEGGRFLCANCNFRYELYPFLKPLV